MLLETGRVVAVDADSVWVETIRRTTCGSCAVQKGCGHGLLNQLGPEGGDIPNIYAHTDGSAGYEAFTTLTSMTDLVDEDGSAIIIHVSEDDHLSQPIGGAGARVACGVIQ